MGGYLAGFLALEAPQRFGALVQFAARLKTEAVPALTAAHRSLPVHMIHGVRDRLVPIAGQERALRELESAGVPAHLERTPGGHRLTAEIVDRARAALESCWLSGC